MSISPKPHEIVHLISMKKKHTIPIDYGINQIIYQFFIPKILTKICSLGFQNLDPFRIKYIMECDVIPTSPQEVDPLGNVDSCNGLDEDGILYSQTLNAALTTSTDDVDAVPKNRKIINIAPPKSRKMLTIRSSTSPPPRSHPSTVTDSSLSHGIVSKLEWLEHIRK